jgi:hypothetical protein
VTIFKRPRRNEHTSKHVLDWLASVNHDPNNVQRTRLASPLSQQACITHTRRARSASALDEQDFAQPFEQQDPSVSTVESTSFHDDSQAGESQYTRLVTTGHYRSLHCAPNDVVYRGPSHELPPAIDRSISQLYRERQSPQPDFVNDRALEDIEAAPKTAVMTYYSAKIFTEFSGVRRDDNLPMDSGQVPSNPQANTRLSRPTPDSLYGYPMDVLGTSLVSVGTTAFGNAVPLLYPFLAIEYKGDGPTSSPSLWVATNQCLGDASTCVNIADNLNKHLCEGSPEITPIDSHAFSVACHGSEARLLVSWKAEDQNIYTRKFGNFCIQDPEQIQMFRTVCRNIIDWGRTERLQQIRNAIDVLAEQSRLAHSKAAKSRSHPQSVEPQRLRKLARTSTSSSVQNDSSRSQKSPSATTSPTSRAHPPIVAPTWLWSENYSVYYYIRGSEYVFQDGHTMPIDKSSI